MSNSANPQLNNWSDERYRTMADHIVRFQAFVAAWQADYAAKGIGALATTDTANTLGAGGPGDVRSPVTGINLINFNAAVNQIATSLATTLVTGVGTTALAQANIAQVNGSVR